MFNEETKLKINKVIAEKLGIDLSAVTPEKKLKTDFSSDSLDNIEIVMELEDTFNIEIPDEDVDGHEDCTVQEVYDYIEKRLDA